MPLLAQVCPDELTQTSWSHTVRAISFCALAAS
jgi:hypothetical protein